MNLKKIVILHLQTELNLTCGVTRTISQIIENSSQDFEHHLISLEGDGLSRFTEFEFNPILLQIKRSSIFGTVKIFLAVVKYCKNNSIQIIHSHHRYFDTLSRPLKFLFRINTITSVQSKVSGKRKLSYKADKLIACSNSIKRHLIDNYNVRENRIEVIANMVDQNQYEKSESTVLTKNEFQISENKFVIGFVGRLNYLEKGIDTLLLALKDLIQINDNIKLIIVGDGIDVSKIQEFIKSYKLNAKIVPSVKNVFPYYKLMNILIVPSKIEPFGIVIIEAGIMEVPVVASNVDGIPELIMHEENGLLFESGNVEELKKQIIRIYNDRKFGEKLAENLHKKVLESYTADKIIPQYEKLYTEILHK